MKTRTFSAKKDWSWWRWDSGSCPGLLYFSFTTGFWHTYYLATIAPPLAALAGIGAVAMYERYIRGGVRGWVLVAAVLVTGLVQVIFLLYTAAWSGPLTAIVGIGTIALAALLICLKYRNRGGSGTLPRLAAAGAIALLFVAPFVWACTPLVYGSGNILPTAGPRLSGQVPGGGGMNAMPGSPSGRNVSNLADYLLSHSTGETYLVAVPSSMGAGAELIIETGKTGHVAGWFLGERRDADRRRAEADDRKRRHTVLLPFRPGGWRGDELGEQRDLQLGPGILYCDPVVCMGRHQGYRGRDHGDPGHGGFRQPVSPGRAGRNARFCRNWGFGCRRPEYPVRLRRRRGAFRGMRRLAAAPGGMR